jgi:hypothetical protein
MSIRSLTILLAMVTAIFFGRALFAAEAPDLVVPRWQPHDFSFTGPAQSPNPFQVSFSAEVTGPAGIKITMPGFFDGQNNWKIRLSPTAPGDWSLQTHSAAPELDGKRATFRCVANPDPKMHGALRVDPQNPHQFLYDDGTHFLPMGYECDWLWAPDSHDPDLKTVAPFLDALARHGFNFIILNAFAYDTTWKRGTTGADDFGPPPLSAWEGAADAPDHSRFNLPYWQHYDRLIDAMNRRGILAHILIKVYNKAVKWPANGTPEDDQYYRWLIARYAAYPNILWDLAKEAHNERDLNYKLGRLRFIRATDPYHRLLTVHDDKANYDRGAYNDLLDVRSDQQHSAWRATMLAHLKQKDWPVVNTEFGYEYGPKGPADKTYNVVQAPEEVVRRAWEIYMAGGSGAYYYTYTAWDVIRLQDSPPGYTYFQHLAEFFNKTAFWKLQPAEDIASAGYCLADPSREYVVFLNAAAPFTLKVEVAAAPLPAQWYQPLTGATRDAGTLPNGTVSLTPPVEWGPGPVALHIGIRPQ